VKRSNANMSLPSYLDSLREELIDFEEYWLREHKKDPEHFPWLMPAGEWWEQMLIWESTEHQTKEVRDEP